MKESDLYNDFYKELVSIIDTAFKNSAKEKNQMQQTQQTQNQMAETKVCKYNSIEEYTKQTGKRFRVTKEQKQRGISREEAFKEFVGTLSWDGKIF